MRTRPFSNRDRAAAGSSDKDFECGICNGCGEDWDERRVEGGYREISYSLVERKVKTVEYKTFWKTSPRFTNILPFCELSRSSFRKLTFSGSVPVGSCKTG